MEIQKKEIKIITILIVIFVILLILIQVKMAILPFLLAFIMAYLLNPFIVYLENKNYSRKGAILLLIIIIFNILFISCLFLFPVFLAELQNLTDIIPQFITYTGDTITELNQEYRRIQMPQIIQESIDQMLNEIEEIIINSIHKITELLLTSIPLIFSLLVSPIITYYILRDIEIIKKSFIKLLPGENEKIIINITGQINQIFVGFLRGQIWISVIVAILIGIGLFIIDVKFYILLGILAGITNMIPYIGPLIGALPAVLIAFLISPLRGGLVILLYVLIQQLESYLIAPKIMSENVGIHPLTIIFSLLAGAEIAGFWGLLLGIPVAGSLKVVFNVIFQNRIMEQ